MMKIDGKAKSPFTASAGIFSFAPTLGTGRFSAGFGRYALNAVLFVLKFHIMLFIRSIKL
jgi:hypothetical protein